MKAITKTIIAVITATSFICPVLAQDAEKKDGAKPKGKKPGAAKMFKKMDANSDGKVSLEEFKALTTKRAKKPLSEENAAKVFKRRDKDSNGSLSLEELTPKPKGAKKKGKGKDGEETPKKKGEDKDKAETGAAVEK